MRYRGDRFVDEFFAPGKVDQDASTVGTVVPEVVTIDSLSGEDTGYLAEWRFSTGVADSINLQCNRYSVSSRKALTA